MSLVMVLISAPVSAVAPSLSIRFLQQEISSLFELAHKDPDLTWGCRPH